MVVYVAFSSSEGHVLISVVRVTAVLARGVVIDTDFVVPVSVHVAFVAVAKRGSAQGGLAGAGGLEDARALLKNGRAVIIPIVMTITVVVAGRLDGVCGLGVSGDGRVADGSDIARVGLAWCLGIDDDIGLGSLLNELLDLTDSVGSSKECNSGKSNSHRFLLLVE